MPDGVGAVLYSSLASTNDTAREAVTRGEIGPTWFAALAQTKGRGRLGRTWVSASGGNLYTSLLFKPDVEPAELAALPFITSLAVREALIIHGADAASTQCKWPNDVLINEKKCSGILIETILGQKNKIEAVIVGIGINLKSFPEDVQFPSTSLLTEAGSAPQPDEFLATLAEVFIKHWLNWILSDLTTTLSEWTQSAWGLGMRRSVETASGRYVGTLEGLADDGALILKLDEGGEKRLYAGDVFSADGRS